MQKLGLEMLRNNYYASFVADQRPVYSQGTNRRRKSEIDIRGLFHSWKSDKQLTDLGRYSLDIILHKVACVSRQKALVN